MSVELLITDDGDIVCPWGSLEYSCPRPDRGEVGPLMLITRGYVDELRDTEIWRPGCGVHSLTERDGRLFAHHDYRGKRWTWELFEAHFSDGKGPEIYIGRWPD